MLRLSLLCSSFSPVLLAHTLSAFPRNLNTYSPELFVALPCTFSSFSISCFRYGLQYTWMQYSNCGLTNVLYVNLSIVSLSLVTIVLLVVLIVILVVLYSVLRIFCSWCEQTAQIGLDHASEDLVKRLCTPDPS